jgi:DNA replication protein DnaC
VSVNNKEGLVDSDSKEELEAQAANRLLMRDRERLGITDKEPVHMRDTIEVTLARLNTEARESGARRRAFDTWFDAVIQKAKDGTCNNCGSGVIKVSRIYSWRETIRVKAMSLAYGACQHCEQVDEIDNDAEWLTGAGVPKNMLHCTMDNWDVDNDGDRKTISVCREFMTKRMGFVILSGLNKGVGKSHLGVSMLRKSGRGRMITQQQLVSALRYNYNFKGGEDIIGNLKKTPFLVLDEMGLSAKGTDVAGALHEILDHRYGMKKRTVITTNLREAEFASELGARLVDRIMEEALFAYCYISGESQRKNRRNNYYE